MIIKCQWSKHLINKQSLSELIEDQNPTICPLQHFKIHVCTIHKHMAGVGTLI